MATVISTAAGKATRRWPAGVLPSEFAAIAFFAYLLALGLSRHLHWRQMWWLAVPPVIIFAATRLERSITRPWTRVTRETLNLSLILIGYWSVEWFDLRTKNVAMQNLWVQWDRVLLHQWGFKAAVESLGGLIPFVLETVYMLLYGIPIIYLAILFLTGSRLRTHRFLLMVILGTLTVYACLPFIPVLGPRFAFPGADLPAYTSFPRFLNTWLHDNMDISTSVFPSGHCGVAFSTAFGLLSATPERRRLWISAFVLATIVYVATIYCRYHYAVDGVASLFLVASVWLALERYSSPDRRNNVVAY